MKARVAVTLKRGVLDPQGKAIEGALLSLGIAGITSVRQGKIFDVEIEGESREAAERALGEACERLLANTVIESYRVAIDEDSVSAGQAVLEAAAVDPAEAAEVAAVAAEMPTEGHP